MYKLKLIKSDIVSGWYILKIIKSGKFMVKYDKIIKTCGPLIHPQERLTQLPPGRTSLLGTALYFRVPTSMSCDWSCHQGHIQGNKTTLKSGGFWHHTFGLTPYPLVN